LIYNETGNGVNRTTEEMEGTVSHLIGIFYGSRIRSVSIAIRLVGIDFRHGQEIFSLFHSVQTGSGAYSASYPMGTVFTELLPGNALIKSVTIFYILKPEQAVKLRKDKMVMRRTTMKTFSSLTGSPLPYHSDPSIVSR
jgi:hypothetical protein